MQPPSLRLCTPHIGLTAYSGLSRMSVHCADLLRLLVWVNPAQAQDGQIQVLSHTLRPNACMFELNAHVLLG